VRTVVVAAGGERLLRSFPGRVEAARRAELAFQVPGLLVEFPAREGQQVAEGDLIAQLRQDEFQARLTALQSQRDQALAALSALRAGERTEQRLRLQAQLRAADAKLANARATFNRFEQLAQSGAVSRAEYDNAQAAFRVAQEERNSARQMLEKGMTAREEDIQAKEAEVRGLEGRVVEANIQLSDSTLRAPYDGVIARRFVDVQQNIRAKQPIVQYQGVNEIEVVADVPETVMVADLRTADFLEMFAEFSAAPGLQFPVHITEVAQTADPVTQTFNVRVAMQAPPPGVTLLPGMTATVTVAYQRAAILDNHILVPISAVFNDGSEQQVAWLIGADQIVARRPVKIGAPTGDQIEILDGLKPGDRIAVAGVSFLREGMKVRDLGDE
jgi:RND family efflux transporter MFP subunit